jgi:hypothetical protein
MRPVPPSAMSSATIRPAGASGTENPAAAAASVVPDCPEELGEGVALIVGNRPDALPAPTELLVPAAAASEGSGIGGSVGPVPTLALAVLGVPEDGARCAVCPGAGVVVVLAGVDVADEADFDEAGVGVEAGATTASVAAALGGVHDSSVGTLAVALTDTEVAPDDVGTWTCISSLDAEPSRFIDPIEHDAEPSPSGQPDV